MSLSQSVYRIAVFASGGGTNFQAIVDAVKVKELDVSIELLVCDKPSAQVIERAKQAGVPTFVFKPKDYDSREAYEREIVAKMQELQIDLVVLAGYMRLVTDTLLKPFENRIINIHPALLPSFPGTKGIADAFDYGVKVTGVTIHFVDGGMDSGPIIAQRTVPIYDNDSLDTLSERIHETEREMYPRVIGWFREGRVKLEGRRVTVDFEQDKRQIGFVN
ncbi:phosphoribosylglycinamide formyltransferase [Paenibacillus turpanensis]|uniref:phosphoribosylglycinamide formyltransferase n=1 Tax=Paenibacillus turpanensis TaxID=2689078 RepID=UPI001408AEA2|nr:phosphoribosylglycinamide formyltransferase [Paenibacillus turpanensis]